MTRRGKRSWQKKKNMKNPAYRGGLQIHPGDIASSSRTNIDDDVKTSASDEPEELAGTRCCRKKNLPPPSAILELPQRPDITKMYEWTVREYLAYDTFLIKKWEIFGFGKEDLGYVSMRDGNSKVAWVFRNFYKKP